MNFLGLFRKKSAPAALPTVRILTAALRSRSLVPQTDVRHDHARPHSF